MILIFGGAYQGKLTYAKEQFDIEKVWDCRESTEPKERARESSSEREEGGSPDIPALPDFSADAICGLEAFARVCADSGVEAADVFRQNRERWADRILIIRDISQGIVPVDPAERAWREMNGRLMIYLAGEAEEVHRVFCGIGRRIK